jgi:hypothetical protein
MPHPLLPLALLLGLTVAAPQDTAGFRHAVARRGCTQEDAPALEVYLGRTRHEGAGEPAAPYLRLEAEWGVWERAGAGGRALELLPLARRDADRRKPIVRAALHEAGSTGEPAWLRGTVRLRRVRVGRGVEGSYDLVTPGDGRRLAGTFTAPWVAARGGCG